MSKKLPPDDLMHPDRRNETGKTLLRRQAERHPDWAVPTYYLDWQSALCLLLVRATDRVSKRELAQITGLRDYEVIEAMKPVAMIEDLTVDGEYLVRSEQPDGTVAGPPDKPDSVPAADEEPEFDPVQRAALDVLFHDRTSIGVRIKQLSTRCKIPGPEMHRAVCELERLGYVHCHTNGLGHIRVVANSRRQPVKPPGGGDPIAMHIRIVVPLVNGGAWTEQRLAARCCELTKDTRRKVLKELVGAGCLEACFDHRGIPAYRVTSIERAEAGLDRLREAKVEEAAQAVKAKAQETAGPS